MSRFLKDKKLFIISLTAVMLVLTLIIGSIAFLYFRQDAPTMNDESSSNTVNSGQQSNSSQASSSASSSDGSSSQASSSASSSDGNSSQTSSSENNSEDDSKTPAVIEFLRPDEMRGVFITPGVDFMLKEGDNEETIKSQIDTSLKNAKNLTINTVIFNTKLADKAIYINSILPTTMSGFDPLKYAVDKAREMSFYTYAIYDVTDVMKDDKIAKADIIDTDVIDFISANIRKFAENYRLDAIILDNYYNITRPDSYMQYLKYGGGVGYNVYMESISRTLFDTCATIIREVSPSTQVGLMTEGVWENSSVNEKGSDTSATFTTLGTGNSDNVKFIKEYMCDFAMVKDLNSTTNKAENFTTIVNWWDKIMVDVDMPYYVVHASSKSATEESGWTEYDQLIKQVLECEKLNAFDGSVFDSLPRLVADPKESTTKLIKYYNREINPAHVLKELAVTRPSKLQYETFEPSVTFQGASDPNTDITINGKKIATDKNGYFAVAMPLVPGDNVFTIVHKGKSVVYKIYRRVVIIKEITPTGNMTVEGDMKVTVSALAYADAQILASFNGKTIELALADTETDATDKSSNYRIFEGAFTIPAATATVQKLGNIAFTGSWQGMKENKVGASVNVNKKTVLADGKPVEVIASQAETFPTNVINDYSDESFYPLPKGTKDFAVGSQIIFNDGKKTFSYYKLASNVRVYSKDIVALDDSSAIGENTVNSVNISSDASYTYVTVDMKQKVSYVSRYDGNNFTVKFNYTSHVPSSVNVDTNPLFSLASFNTTTLNLKFAKPGAFTGYKAYYSEDKLILRFNNPPAISGNSLNGIRISIDSGHGGPDGGAQGFLPAYPESVVVNQVSQKLYGELSARGASVQLISTTSGELPMAQRISSAKQNNSQVLVSIHANSGGMNANGTEAYYFYPFSKNLAAFASGNVSSALDTTNRGAKFAYFYMTRDSQFASSLIELGFMSNEKEYKKLISEDYQQQMACAIADAITTYLKSASTGGNYGTVTNPPNDNNATGGEITGGDTTIPTPDTIPSAEPSNPSDQNSDTSSSIPEDVVNESNSTGPTEGKVERIDFSPSEVNIAIGKSKKLNIVFTPQNPDNKNLKWESYDKSIAIVDENGKVVGIAEGETLISATSEDTGEYVECLVKVTSKATSDTSSDNADAPLPPK